MENYKNSAVETAEFIRSHIDKPPQIGLLSGTGLGESILPTDISASFNYREIPHFPVSTVTNHFGRLLIGSLQSRQVLALQGRFHLYEGYSPKEVAFPVRVMQELGIKILIISNAAGGINPEFKEGDIMLIADHINLTGSNPLVGPNEDSWGIRFPDMVQAYDENLIKIAVNSALEVGLHIRKGIYAGLKGPSLETPAEIRFLRAIGADAVGLSTVMEVIAAIHAGMRVLGLSVITNINDPDTPIPATVSQVVAVAEKITPKLAATIRSVIENTDDYQLN